MKRVLAITAIVFVALALFSPTLSARAGTEITVQITERQLNAEFGLTEPVGDVRNFSIEVQEGRIGLIGVFGAPGQPPERVVMGILVAIDNGHLVWTVMGASVNDQYFTPEQLAAFNAQYPVTPAMNDTVQHFLTRYGKNLYFTGIALSNHTITVRFTRDGAPPSGPSAPSAPSTPSAPAGNTLTNCTVTTTTDLNLRAAANSRGAVLTVVPNGTQLAATSRQGSWYYVSFQGTAGWLNTGFLKKVGTCR